MTTFDDDDIQRVNLILEQEAEDGFEGDGKALADKYMELSEDYDDLRPAYHNRYANPEGFKQAIKAVKKVDSAKRQLANARAQTPGEFEKQWHRLINGG